LRGGAIARRYYCKEAFNGQRTQKYYCKEAFNGHRYYWYYCKEAFNGQRTQKLQYWQPQKASLCAISFSWCGNVRSTPPAPVYRA
jgi:hypothetical protein